MAESRNNLNEPLSDRKKSFEICGMNHDMVSCKMFEGKLVETRLSIIKDMQSLCQLFKIWKYGQ